MTEVFAGELLLPGGAVVRRGMTFSGTTSTGATFSGRINNRIGDGVQGGSPDGQPLNSIPD
jgi:hypothetical protein